MYKCCWHWTNQCLVSSSVRDKKKLEQWPVQSQPTQNECKETKSVMHKLLTKQISIWLANKAVNKITEIMTCSKSTANALASCKQNNTDGLFGDTG